MLELFRKYPKHTDTALLIGGFLLGVNLFRFIVLSAISVVDPNFDAGPMGYHWANPSVAGILIGIGFALLEFRVWPRMQPKMSALALVGLKLLVWSVLIVVTMVVVSVSVGFLTGTESWSKFDTRLYAFVNSSVVVALYLYLLLLGVSLSFLHAIGDRFGHGIIFNYLTGKYRTPVVEDRVFLFVDLNSSTTLAEELGHTVYSRLLNRCFDDLSTLLPRYDAEIYQYVGDEVVLTWNRAHLKDASQPVRLFFEFRALLAQHAEGYQQDFKVTPGSR